MSRSSPHFKQSSVMLTELCALCLCVCVYNKKFSCERCWRYERPLTDETHLHSPLNISADSCISVNTTHNAFAYKHTLNAIRNARAMYITFGTCQLPPLGERVVPQFISEIGRSMRGSSGERGCEIAWEIEHSGGEDPYGDGGRLWMSRYRGFECRNTAEYWTFIWKRSSYGFPGCLLSLGISKWDFLLAGVCLQVASIGVKLPKER